MNSARSLKPMALLSIATLGDLLGVHVTGSLDVSGKRSVAEAAMDSNFLIVPDIMPDYVFASSDDLVTIVRFDKDDDLSVSYEAAHLTLELGMAISMGNGHAEPSEIRQLSYVLERNFSFTDLDVRALSALKDFSLMYPPDISKITYRMSRRMTLSECQCLARTMTTVAASGAIGSGKIIVMRTLFSSFKLDERDLYQRLMNCRSSASGIIEVDPIPTLSRGEVIPRREPMVRINLELVASKKRETETIGRILSEIFKSGD
ncbi:MAG: hypothetical protein LBT23_09505 [Synergistaceae bacterium]|nr:hypothetical protein [Synergistaceae bacterium]